MISKKTTVKPREISNVSRDKDNNIEGNSIQENSRDENKDSGEKQALSKEKKADLENILKKFFRYFDPHH